MFLLKLDDLKKGGTGRETDVTLCSEADKCRSG